jgi:hypothetical protein
MARVRPESQPVFGTRHEDLGRPIIDEKWLGGFNRKVNQTVHQNDIRFVMGRKPGVGYVLWRDLKKLVASPDSLISGARDTDEVVDRLIDEAILAENFAVSAVKAAYGALKIGPAGLPSPNPKRFQVRLEVTDPSMPGSIKGFLFNNERRAVVTALGLDTSRLSDPTDNKVVVDLGSLIPNRGQKVSYAELNDIAQEILPPSDTERRLLFGPDGPMGTFY